MSPSPDTPTADSVAQQKTTQPENTLRDAVTFAKDLMKNYGHDPVPGRLITDDKHATAAFESWLDVGPKIQHTEADPLRSQRRVKWEDYMSAGINFEVDADEKKFDDFLTDLEKWGGYNMKGLRVLSEAEILAKSSQAGTELRNSVYPASREGEKTIPGSEPPQTEDKM